MCLIGCTQAAYIASHYAAKEFRNVVRINQVWLCMCLRQRTLTFDRDSKARMTNIM